MMQRRTTRHTRRLFAAVGLAAAATLSVAPQPASAAGINVTTTAVTVANDGLCTLPEAITAANTDTASGSLSGECPAGSGPDQIFILFSPPGTISVGPGGLPPITSVMTFFCADGTVIDGTNAGTNPGLTVDTGNLVLLGLTIRGFVGGGIAATDSSLSLTDVWVDGNGSPRSKLGGISFETTNNAVLTIDSSTISDNTTSAGGGGVFISGPAIGHIRNSTIVNNAAINEAFEVFGGGVNYAGPAGSAFSIDSSTIVGNDAVFGAGIVGSGSAILSVLNSIVADNTGGGDVDSEESGFYISGGGNVIGDGTNTADFTATDDVTGQAAGVAPLTDNGGRTPTMALQPGSPAVDRITTPTVTFDQRRVARPQGTHPDSGAYEFLLPELTMLDFPCRAYDSITSNDGPLAQGKDPRAIQITGNCGIPASADAVVFTVTASKPLAPGNLRLSAAGVVPNGGVVNFTNNDLHNSNTVTIELSPAGAIEASANGGAAPDGTLLTDVLLDAVAYYAPVPGLDYFPVTPCATFDSRPSEGATGSFQGPFHDLDQMPAIDVVGTFPAGQGGGNTGCGVPATADTVVVNLVAVNATGRGTLGIPFLTAVSFDQIGMNNSAVAYLNLNGGETAQISTVTSATTHVRVVVLGYLDDVGTGTAYTPVTPCAAFDTRTTEGATGAFGGARVGDNVTTYQITGTIPTAQGGNGANCGVPSNATAVLINLVAVNSIRAGNLQAYATGTTPTGGILNFAPLTPAMNNSNAVPVPINASGQMDIRTNAGPTGVGQPTTHIRGIVLGYYTD